MLVSGASPQIRTQVPGKCQELQRARSEATSLAELRARHGSCWRIRRGGRLAARAAVPGKGGAVIDRPTTATPGITEKGSTKRKKPPIYRVMLHNDSFNRREYVVSVILKVIDGYTVDEAVNVMQEAHMNGLACVISCSQEEAEKYCEGLRSNGLISSLEPDSGA